MFLELASRSLWLDEGATIAISTQHGSALWHAIAHDGGNMLGYYLFQHELIALFGHAPAVIRAPSALATVVTVGLVGAIGRRLFDRRVAFAAALLAAVSLPLVFWGQDARAYAPMLTFICASFLALTYVTEDAAARGVRLAWLAWAASLVLASYMSFVAVLVVPGQVLVLWSLSPGGLAGDGGVPRRRDRRLRSDRRARRPPGLGPAVLGALALARPDRRDAPLGHVVRHAAECPPDRRSAPCSSGSRSSR